MTVGFIGLGRMGQNIVLHLFEKRISVVGYNRTGQITRDFLRRLKRKHYSGSFTAAESLAEVVSGLSAPRTVILMVTAGKPVDSVIDGLVAAGLTRGDTVIDMGNSYFKDTTRRYQQLKKSGISYIDCGISGGISGARHGASLMLGGNRAAVYDRKALWTALSVKDGWIYLGPSGAGHFVKMVHNGIEYGIAQVLGEGFELIRESPYDLDPAAVAGSYSRGSVIRSWLVDLLYQALKKDHNLESYRGVVGGGETGRWAIETAAEMGVDVGTMKLALKAREQSGVKQRFAGKVVSALRMGYGGHAEPEKVS